LPIIKIFPIIVLMQRNFKYTCTYIVFLALLPYLGISQQFVEIQFGSSLYNFSNQIKKLELAPTLAVNYSIINSSNGWGADIRFSSVLKNNTKWENAIKLGIQKQIYKKFRHKVIANLGIKMFMGEHQENYKFESNIFYLNNWISPSLSYFYTLKVKRRRQKPYLIKVQLAQTEVNSLGIYFGISKYLKAYKGKSNCDCPDFQHH